MGLLDWIKDRREKRKQRKIDRRERRKNQKVYVDFPVSNPFLFLGVLMAIFVALLVFKYHPELVPDVGSFLSTKDTIQSRTSGEYLLASDLYTARVHGCNVLAYKEGKRSLTMILRYHVNAKYNLNLVEFSIDNGKDIPQFTSKVAEDITGASIQIDSADIKNAMLPAQLTTKTAITISLPSEDIEVVQEKYAGITGNLQEGELPGVEIFDYMGDFSADEDDMIADAFLNLFLQNGRQSTVSRFSDEESNPYSKYLKNIKVLDNERYTSNVSFAVGTILERLVQTSRVSVMLSLEQYYKALGYQEVIVNDATGNRIAE